MKIAYMFLMTNIFWILFMTDILRWHIIEDYGYGVRRDSASSSYGRISEESDTNRDAASGDVQIFAPDDDDGSLSESDSTHDDDSSLSESDSTDDEDDGDWEAGGRKDENIENQEGTRDTRAVGKKRPQIDNAPSRDGRISDTDSDVASAVVQSFPHHSFYERDSMDDASSRYRRISEESDTNSDAASGDVQRFLPDDDDSSLYERDSMDDASSRYGRISEESDTNSDAATGDVQRFPPDDDDGSLYERDSMDDASSRYGRISEESDTSSDAATVQRFPPDDDYESEDDGENVGLEQQSDAESDTNSDAASGDDDGNVCELDPKDDASIWHGSCSEESDTNSDAASRDVQRFPPDDDYESEDDGENVGLEQQPDAESLVRTSRALSNPSVADFVEETDTEGNANHNQEQQHTVPTYSVVLQEIIHEITDRVAKSPTVLVLQLVGRLLGLRLLGLSAVVFVGLVMVFCFLWRWEGTG